MTNRRHYSEDEISAIFEQAVEAQETAKRNLPSKEGLTLDELKKIGAEHGITPEFIAQAAASLDRPKAVPQQEKKLLGFPIRVERSVDLPRALTDAEWDRLVVDLRETFNAKGKIEQSGSLRQWTNGNLQALVEPTSDGYRLRMRSLKSSGREGVLTGGGFFLAGLVLLLVYLFSDTFDVDGVESLIPVLMLLFGGAALGYNAFRLPQWQQLRAQQMEGIGERVMSILADFERQSSIRAEPQIQLEEEDLYGQQSNPYKTRTGGRESS